MRISLSIAPQPSGTPPPPPTTGIMWTKNTAMALNTVYPSNAYLFAHGLFGSNGPQYTLQEYIGSAIDTTNKKLYICAPGGHHGSGDNSVYIFDLNANTVTRPYDPSPYIVDPPGPYPGPNPLAPLNGPAANHNYDAVEFCTANGKVYMWGLIGYDASNGNTYPWNPPLAPSFGGDGIYYSILVETWEFDPTKTGETSPTWHGWTKKSTFPVLSSPNAAGHTIGQSAVWIPDINRFVIFSGGDTIYYDPINDVYGSWVGANGNVYGNNPVGTYVAHRKEVWWFAGGVASGNPTVVAKQDVSTTTLGAQVLVSPASGIVAPQGLNGGLKYDSTTQNIVCWTNTGDLWFYNPDTLAWRFVAIDVTSPVPFIENSGAGGIWSRFRILASDRKCIALTDQTGVWTGTLPSDISTLPVWTAPPDPVNVKNLDNSTFGPYATVQAAHDAATTLAGATITIDDPPAVPGFWQMAATINKDSITLKGATTACKIRGSATADGGVGAFSIHGDNFVADNIEGFGCYGGDASAGASFFRVFKNATFNSGIYLHHNDMGIETASNATATITINGGKYELNGNPAAPFDGKSHNIYIQYYGAVVATGAQFNHALYLGHCFKSRAKTTTIVNCTFDTFNATNQTSRLIDIPDGGIIDIHGCTFKQGLTDNLDIIGIARELFSDPLLPAGWPGAHSATIHDNTITSQRSSIYFFSTLLPATVHYANNSMTKSASQSFSWVDPTHPGTTSDDGGNTITIV